MIKIAPSLLSADFTKLGEEVKQIVQDGADYLHFDVMDGVFVPNINFGFKVIQDLRKTTDAFFDVHLMIVEPEKYIERFAKAGADLITVHYEACKKPIVEVLQEIRSYGIRSAVSIKPKTPVSVLKELLPYVDLVLIMSVEPGFGGQSFMEASIERVREVKGMIDESGYDIEIEIDGGINVQNAKLVKEAGVNVLVAGSTVFNAKDRKEVIRQLREA